MTKEEKQNKIKELTLFIESLKFKIDASRLKLKFSNDVGTTLVVAWQNINYTLQIRMTLEQIRTIQAIPTYLKGLAIVGENKPEIIIKT